MGASNQPFLALQEDLSWFMECPEIRLVHIATGGDERPIVLQQVALLEGDARNKSPFFELEDAHTKSEPGWGVRAERMRVIHEARRDAMAKEGYALGPLPGIIHDERGVVTLGRQIQQCLVAQAMVPELSGLVLVLAPALLEAPEDFAHGVLELLHVEAFAHVRMVVIELGDALVESLMRPLGAAGLHTTCIINKDEQYKEQSALLGAAAQAPAGASPEMQSGFAGPKDVCAPPRHGKGPRDAPLTPEVEQALAREMGPMASLVGPAGKLLRQRVLGAAHAMQEARFADAIRLQTEACEQCMALGISRLACTLEISLAAYILAAGLRPRAITAFESATARAAAAGTADLEAQALIGLGNVRVLDGDLEGAARDYVRAGEAAERGQLPPLAIEAYRMAGHVALQAGAESGAITVWQRALGIASANSPELAGASSAPVVARALAKVLLGHGSHASAQSLLDQADFYERAALATKEAPKSVPAPQAGGSGSAQGAIDVRG